MSRTSIEPGVELRPPSPGFGWGCVGRPPLVIRPARGGPPVVVDPPLVLAPVDGVFDQPFRVIAKRCGAGLTVSEFINANQVIHGAGPVRTVTARGGNEHPFSIQLSDHEPERLARAAAMLEEQVGPEVFDLNMGCPSNNVTGSCNGVSLMREPDRVRAIVRAVVAATSRPVTVKIRLGWDEASLNAVEIARIAEGEGAAMVTVHGRTRAQMYKGRANRERIAEVVRALSIPVVGNGDVDSAASATDMFERTGCAAVMVARGAFGDPWLLTRIARGDDTLAPTPAERLAVCREQLLRSVELFGAVSGVHRMRKHIGWAITGFSGAAEMRRRYMTLETPGDCLAALDDFFARAVEVDPAADVAVAAVA